MTTRRDRLQTLAAIAALAEERALAPLATAQARLAAARAEVAQIRQARDGLTLDATDPFQARMTIRMAQSLRDRQAAALSELATREAAVEIARTVARPAVGRRIALERLLSGKK